MRKVSILGCVAVLMATTAHAECGDPTRRAAFMGPDSTPAVATTSMELAPANLVVSGWSCQLSFDDRVHLKCTRSSERYEKSGTNASFLRCGPGDFYVIWTGQ